VPSELAWQTLLSEPFVLMVPRELADRPWRTLLRTQPFIRYERNSFGGRLVDRFLKKIRVTVNDVIELDELQGIVGLVSRKVGVALIPQSSALVIPDEVSVLSLGEDTFYRDIGLVQRETRAMQSATLQFATCVYAACGVRP
jgi:DNA-binding transcriptional LysR family regulator